MANAYATIAAKGMRATPYLVKKVTSADGTVNYKAQKQTKVAFDQDVAIDATEAMTHVVTEGTGAGRAGARPAGRGQDRYDDREQGGLVRRVHPPARGGGRHLQRRQRQAQADAEHRRLR